MPIHLENSSFTFIMSEIPFCNRVFPQVPGLLYVLCNIIGRVVSDDWQLPDRFESESLSRNTHFLAVDGLLASLSSEMLLVTKAPAARSK